MKRMKTHRAKDAKIFKDTASKIKTKNLPGNALRGGIRL